MCSPSHAQNLWREPVHGHRRRWARPRERHDRYRDRGHWFRSRGGRGRHGNTPISGPPQAAATRVSSPRSHVEALPWFAALSESSLRAPLLIASSWTPPDSPCRARPACCCRLVSEPRTAGVIAVEQRGTEQARPELCSACSAVSSLAGHRRDGTGCGLSLPFVSDAQSLSRSSRSFLFNRSTTARRQDVNRLHLAHYTGKVLAACV